MTYTKPYIDGDDIPEQPIPLRLVPFITDWDIGMMLELFAMDEIEHKLPIEVHEYYEDREPALVSPGVLQRLKQELTAGISQKKALQRIRCNYFVWSTNLIHTYYIYKRDYEGYEVGAIESLNWHPATGDCIKEIEACSDFYNLQPAKYKRLIKKRGRKTSTEERHKTFLEKAKAIRKIYTDYTISSIANIVALDNKANPSSRKPETIRKILGENKESWGFLKRPK